ncbi:MAG: NrdH-redoxin [Myxococcaceae bacterium]|nr:NrdH-redoxin [Myxococcaceae bacterium]
MTQLRQERPALVVQEWAIDEDATARDRLQALAAARSVSVAGVPAILVGDERQGTLLFGFDRAETTGARLRQLLDGAPTAGADATPLCQPEAQAACEGDTVSLPVLGAVRVKDFGLPLFTIVVGLLDGFNPCAMWVLLFLLSLLVNLKSRSRMALVAGVFVLVSGVVYFAFMAAWLNVFLLVGLSRAVQLVLGGLAVVMGALNVKEFVAFKRGPSLTISERAQAGIAARVRDILHAPGLLAALAGAAVLAVLVNFVELLCTAGFPAVYSHVLTSQHLPAWQNYGYLALYNLAYIVDDSLMVGIAVATLSRRRLQEREGRWLKLISGIVMLALALVLLFKPGWLAVLG